MSTADFRWLHEEAWETLHKERVLAASPNAGIHGVNAPLKDPSGRRRGTAPIVAGRYVLELPEGTPVAAIEARLQVGTFRALQIDVSACAAPGGWSGAAAAALSFAVSACLIMSEADTLLLVGATPGAQAELSALAWGDERRVWTPRRGDAELAALRRARSAAVAQSATDMRAGAQIAVTAIDPPVWWACSRAIQDRKSLSYLEKRVAFSKKPSLEEATRRAPTGLFSRFGALFGRR